MARAWPSRYGNQPVGALCKRAFRGCLSDRHCACPSLRLSESWILGARPFKGLACSRSRCLQGRVLESRAPHPVNPDSDNSSYFVTRQRVWSYGGRLRLPFGDAGAPANVETFHNLNLPVLSISTTAYRKATGFLPIRVNPPSVNMDKSFVAVEPALKLKFATFIGFTNVQGPVWCLTCWHVYRRGVDLHR